MNDRFEEVITILYKYNINRFWKMTPKYLQAYTNRICGDYLYDNSIAYKNSKFSWVSSFFLHSILIIFGSFISVLKGRIKFKTVPIKESKIIVLPFCWRFVWFSRLPELIEEELRIVYHPFFHFDYYKKNLDGYNTNKVAPEFYCFDIKSILKSLYLLIFSYRRLKKCSKEMDNLFGIYTGKFSRIFFFPILYGEFMKHFLERKINTCNRITWIFDYDYDYKYIVFNNIIHQLRENDITIHIQHGSFVTESPDFCNPVCDYSLCCSVREKIVIENNNYFKSQIRVLGAPLQSFEDYRQISKTKESFDLLVLLTATDEKWKIDPQIKILQLIDVVKYKVMIRYRPKSKQFDRESLGPYTTHMFESNGTSLLDDVLSAKIVICFSEDALYTAIRCNRPIVYVRNIDIDKYYLFSEKSYFFNIVKDTEYLNVDIDELIVSRNQCFYESDKFIYNNFGFIQLKEVKQQLNVILDEIEQINGRSL